MLDSPHVGSSSSGNFVSCFLDYLILTHPMLAVGMCHERLSDGHP